MFSFSLHGSWPAPARVGARSPLEEKKQTISLCLGPNFLIMGGIFCLWTPFHPVRCLFSILETESGCMMGVGGCIVGDAQRYTKIR